MTEKRLLQIAVAVACLVPFSASLTGILQGAAAFGHGHDLPRDLDSHLRYLSGIFLVMGAAFAWCVPGIERKTALFRLLGAMVVVGGLARLMSLAAVGVPGPGMRFGLVMEVGVVPALMLWQGRVARRAARGG